MPLKSPLNIEYRAVHPMVRVSKDLQHKPSDEASEALKHKDQTLDPEKSFIAVKRVQIGKNGEVIRLQIKGYDRGQYDGFWVTEYTRYGSRTVHCLPADHLNALSGPISPEKLLMVANFPILQRWVGVQYHPETEIESHYGEMSVARCYDLDPQIAVGYTQNAWPPFIFIMRNTYTDHINTYHSHIKSSHSPVI